MRKAHVILRQLKLFQMQALFIYQYAPIKVTSVRAIMKAYLLFSIYDLSTKTL